MSWIKRKQNENTLNIQNVIERLRIDDSSIIANIYSLIYNQMEKEAKRTSDLDSKAYNMIGITGICITLIFGFGGILAQYIKEPIWLVVMMTLYLGTFTFTLASLLFALNSAKARSNFRTVNDEDVFNKEMINDSITAYQRFLTAHFWRIYRNNHAINEEKGILLKSSFRMFFIAMLFLFLITIAIGQHVFKNGGFKWVKIQKNQSQLEFRQKAH